MIPVQRIHHEFKLHYNKLNSNHKRDFPAAYIDDLINRAQLEYVDIFATGTNAKKFKIGFEVTQQRTEMLSPLVITSKQSIPVYIDSESNFYDVFEYLLPLDYHYYVRGTIKTNCGTFTIDPKQHDDIGTLLTGYHTRPSLQWLRFPSLFAKTSNADGKSVYIYMPNDVPIQEFSITYIKKPTKVFIGGYNTLEYISGDSSAYNTSTGVVNSELPEDYLHVLVDIMVDIVSRILQDGASVQLMQDKLIQQY